ncbi:uncharacterized protein [Antedon mediterranea]|uniref:uncharacterized protein n=1 Tax=Antedon mediterranea TaxID=105859 RepID=UPI003AF4E0E9
MKNLYTDMSFKWDTHYLNTHESSTFSHRKKLKRLNIFCCLLFLQNDQAYLPFHMLITDAIDKFTNSSAKCLGLLAQFGICVSKDTFLRYQTHVAELEMTSKPFVSNAFTIISIDNIDKNSQYAAVRSSQMSRGFHGTSVQAVQPLPNSAKLTCSIPLQAQVQEMELDERRQRKIQLSTLTKLESDSLSLQDQFLFQYVLTKTSAHLLTPDISLAGIKAAHHGSTSLQTEQSDIQFVAVMAEPADSKETIQNTLSMLYSKYDIGNTMEQLVVAGDAKTYDILMNLKREYGTDLNWMLPYIGDWHLLKNCQAPIMKVYLDAGLKDLLLAGGYRGAKLASVANATSFDTTHHFLLQVWEAFYRFQVEAFLSDCTPSFREKITTNLDNCISHSLQEGQDFLCHTDTSSITSIFPTCKDKFNEFCQRLCKSNATFRFWHNFVHRDMFHYIGLFLAIRSRNFSLRNACVLQVAPLFYALDRHRYLNILPFHIADLKSYPSHIRDFFSMGAFSVSITGDNWSCIAFDEAHEMVINKNVKMALTTTGQEGLTKLVHYLPHRTRSVCNLSSQLSRNFKSSSLTYLSPSLIRYEEGNVRSFLMELKKTTVLQTGSSSLLYHLFTDEAAAQKVSSDLLNFYEYGQEDLHSYIKCVVLSLPGAKRPVRKNRKVSTFTPPKTTVAKQRKEIQDQKLQLECLRHQVAWSKSHGQVITDFHQVLSLPRALCTADGMPYKANKAVCSSFFKSRYPGAFSDSYKPSLESTAYIAEGMFLINTTPLPSHETFKDYMNFLFRQWVLRPFYDYRAKEVHVVFDHPCRHGPSPKEVERVRRDKNVNNNEINFHSIDADDKLPSQWRAFLAVRSQKRLLVNLISSYFISVASQNLRNGQIFLTAGGFDGDNTDKCFCSSNTETKVASEYNSNHEEGDSRVWLHFAKTSCSCVIIYSPDRDKLHVGLPIVQAVPDKKTIIQLKASRSDNVYVCINSLLLSFSTDLSLQPLGDMLCTVPKLLQTLFISSGCDYVSFFKGYSKKRFMEVFYRNCKFVSGGIHTGYLNQIGPDVQHLGLLAFYRLVGCVYFQQNLAAFSVDTAEELFQNINTSDLNDLDKHVKFLQVIRESTFHRIKSEDQWIPTVDALKFHWLRSCWVGLVWSQASVNSVDVPDLTKYGWSQTDQGVSITWDSEENMKKVRESVRYPKNGCKCKTGCITGRCACIKRKQQCGPGCTCVNCKNLNEDPITSSEESDTNSECSDELNDFDNSEKHDMNLQLFS